jgi:DNA-binding PadR family transcriptional regulator
MPSKEPIRDLIMLMLDRHPSHGYELKRALEPHVGNVEITSLYRWLREMEQEGLIVSTIREGPHGPSRKIYTIGPRGESHLRHLLRNAFWVLLHFYDEFRQFQLTHNLDEKKEIEIDVPEGKMLLCLASPFMEGDLGAIQFALDYSSNSSLYVLGNLDFWKRKRSDIAYIKGSLEDIKSRDKQFDELWILGMPPRNLLPRIVVEAIRVLKHGGTLRILAPFAFFDEPNEPSLEAFIRLTSSHLFPELGIVEGQEVCQLFQQLFCEYGTFKITYGYVQFWGTTEFIS